MANLCDKYTFCRDRNTKYSCVLQKYYNKAIAFAQSEITLSMCYANRSAVYYELSMFDLCLENIELARTHNLPERLEEKMNLRQQAAVTHLLSQRITTPKWLCTKWFT